MAGVRDQIYAIREELIEQRAKTAAAECAGDVLANLLGPKFVSEETFREMYKKDPMIWIAAIIAYLDEEKEA